MNLGPKISHLATFGHNENFSQRRNEQILRKHVTDRGANRLEFTGPSDKQIRNYRIRNPVSLLLSCKKKKYKNKLKKLGFINNILSKK